MGFTELKKKVRTEQNKTKKVPSIFQWSSDPVKIRNNI